MAWPVAFAADRSTFVNMELKAYANDEAAASVKQVLLGRGCHQGGLARTPAAKTGRRRALSCMVSDLVVISC
jgi:hypothetical protein